MPYREMMDALFVLRKVWWGAKRSALGICTPGIHHYNQLKKIGYYKFNYLKTKKNSMWFLCGDSIPEVDLNDIIIDDKRYTGIYINWLLIYIKKHDDLYTTLSSKIFSRILFHINL